MLRQVDYPMGQSDTLPVNGKTMLRIYEGDSTLFQCLMFRTQSALIIQPDMMCNVTLIDQGGGERLYLEEDNPRPLTVRNDSTITIQRNGVLYTWQRADSISREWGDEIRAIIVADMTSNAGRGFYHSYVLSAKEREQASLIQVFIYSTIAFIILVGIITMIAIANRRAKRRLQLQLQQIQEVHDERPQSVRQAMESVETAFFVSDEYLSLQRRMTTGQRLHDDEWESIERLLKRSYPGFTSQLRTLHPMSELEYHVCLLIKLRIAPSDIADVLLRDVSTISTVRSRLYKKVFGKKGGAKEWDEFILSIGA